MNRIVVKVCRDDNYSNVVMPISLLTVGSRRR